MKRFCSISRFLTRRPLSSSLRFPIQNHAVITTRIRPRWFGTETNSKPDDDDGGEEKKDKKKGTPIDDATAKKLAEGAKLQQKMWDTFMPDTNMSITHPAVAIMVVVVIAMQVFIIQQFGNQPVDENKLKADRLAERQRLREKEKVNLSVGGAPNEHVKSDGEELKFDPKSISPPEGENEQRHHLHMAKESIMQAEQLARHAGKSMEQLEKSMEELGRADRAAEIRQANDRTLLPLSKQNSKHFVIMPNIFL